MKRVLVPPRNNWQKSLEDLGFSFHSIGGIYWNEGVCYEFESKEIDRIEAITEDMNNMCLNAVEHVIKNDLFHRLRINKEWAQFIKKSWERKDLTIYGRFDFSYDGKSEPKLLEYNADTPTALYESSVIQWFWLQDVFPKYDQFNSIHEKLEDVFLKLKNKMGIFDKLYFTCVEHHKEDFVTTEYMRDVASQKGIATKQIYINDIGFSKETSRFYDLDEEEIKYLFKLYPWEWIVSDEFGDMVLNETVNFFEPAWKMILSNKGIMAIMWEMYPEHPNLLPCYFESSKIKDNYVRKPLLSREGANIKIFGKNISSEETGGSYGKEGYVYQELKELPCFDGNYPVIGSWMVDGQPAGIGIREDLTMITKDTSRFVPHYFI
ncbi:MAG: glutathionylspermidine synthase family protein [Nitrospiraceae bacterium]|nr:glutathionylspermidine synthase family protein [Nitrospiraceae bacterium]